jgi:hypothetical protein
MKRREMEEEKWKKCDGLKLKDQIKIKAVTEIHLVGKYLEIFKNSCSPPGKNLKYTKFIYILIKCV